MIKVFTGNIKDLDNYTLIVPFNKELYYKEKFIDKNYKMYNLRNFLLTIYNGKEKLVSKNISYIEMYNTYNELKDNLLYYKNVDSYSFVKDLLDTYEKYYDYDLKNNSKTNELNIIFKKYE